MHSLHVPQKHQFASLRKLPLLTEHQNRAWLFPKLSLLLEYIGLEFDCSLQKSIDACSLSPKYLFHIFTWMGWFTLVAVQGSNMCLFIPFTLFICITLTSREDTISATSGAEFGATLGPNQRGLRTSMHMTRQRHGRHFYRCNCCDVIFY